MLFYFVVCNKFHVCVNTLLGVNNFSYFVVCVVILSQPVYPYSALRMEASSYSEKSVLTYQTTRCHNAESQSINTDCSQNPQCCTIL
jgi:hypothetical protein